LIVNIWGVFIVVREEDEIYLEVFINFNGEDWGGCYWIDNYDLIIILICY
jgi:hypothetical protein